MGRRNRGFIYPAEGFAIVIAYSEAYTEGFGFSFGRNGIYMVKTFLCLRHIFTLKFKGIVKCGGNKTLFTENSKTYVTIIKHRIKNGYGLCVGFTVIVAEGSNAFAKGAYMLNPVA